MDVREWLESERCLVGGEPRDFREWLEPMEGELFGLEVEEVDFREWLELIKGEPFAFLEEVDFRELLDPVEGEPFDSLEEELDLREWVESVLFFLLCFENDEALGGGTGRISFKSP